MLEPIVVSWEQGLVWLGPIERPFDSRELGARAKVQHA